jgi:uncharacterized membrane protein YczE
MAMMVRAGLGLDPWDVFHQGLALNTGMTIGIASAVVGVAVLVAWIPLRNRPGVGTVANVIVIAVTVDAGLAILPTPTSFAVRVAMMVGAVVLNAISTVLYIGAGLGPGPRDGLMTGIVKRFPRLSIRLVRTTIELSVLGVGFGTLHEGPVAFELVVAKRPAALAPEEVDAYIEASRKELADAAAAGLPLRRQRANPCGRSDLGVKTAGQKSRRNRFTTMGECPTRRRQRRPRPADRLREGHAAARRPGSRRAGHVVGGARRTLGGHRAERCG